MERGTGRGFDSRRLHHSTTSLLRSVAIVAVIAVAAVMVLLAAAVGAVGAMLGIDTPQVSIAARSPQVVTGWPWGQCTWYVALRRVEIGEPVTWSGDAWQWLENAAAQGVAERVTPARARLAYSSEVVAMTRDTVTLRS
jgi:hypothetical protein